MFFAWLEPDVARELIAGRPYGASTCVIAPTASAAPDGAGGFTLPGRWAFNTGVRHARFSQVAAAMLDEHGVPRTGEGGVPQWWLAFFQSDHGQVLDTWDSAGLRGTGSHDLVLEGLPVPAELARTETRGLTERRQLADDSHVQAQLAAAEDGLQSARVFAFDVIGQLGDTACAGDSLSLDQRAQLSLAT